jgi:hypothetical protein
MIVVCRFDIRCYIIYYILLHIIYYTYIILLYTLLFFCSIFSSSSVLSSSSVYIIRFLSYLLFILLEPYLILYTPLLILSHLLSPLIPISHPSFLSITSSLSHLPLQSPSSQYSFYTCRYLHILIYILPNPKYLTPHKLSEGCLEWCSFISIWFCLMFRAGVDV